MPRWARGGLHWSQAARRLLGSEPCGILVLLGHVQKIVLKFALLTPTTERFCIFVQRLSTHIVRVEREMVLVSARHPAVSSAAVRQIVVSANAAAVDLLQQK